MALNFDTVYDNGMCKSRPSRPKTSIRHDKNKACLNRGAVGRPGEKQDGLDYFEVATERLEEGKPIGLGDIGLAPVVQALGASQYARRGRVDACLHIFQRWTQTNAGHAELHIQLEERDLLRARIDASPLQVSMSREFGQEGGN